jgi:glutathione S-transferase
MMKLFDSAFSPFARKVRMVLEHKGLSFEAIDGLLKSNHGALKAVNGRIEVPVLLDGDLVVVNSADIVSYLDAQYPANPVYPVSAAARVRARAWERAADSFIDAILINISYWVWADRKDAMPSGLLEAARADLAQVYNALDRDLTSREYVSGPLSMADIALFPHLVSLKTLQVEFSAETHPCGQKIGIGGRTCSSQTYERARAGTTPSEATSGCKRLPRSPDCDGAVRVRH